MPIPNRNPSDTKKTPQNIFNNSYDEDFDVIAVEILGYDPVNDTLRRIAVDSEGKLKTAV